MSVGGANLDLRAGGCVPIARVAAVTCTDRGESMPALAARMHLAQLPGGLFGRCPRCRQAGLVAST